MANKFVTADLIFLKNESPSGENKYMINVSPWRLKVKASDTLYLIIRKGNLKDAFLEKVTSHKYSILPGEGGVQTYGPYNFEFDTPIPVKKPSSDTASGDYGMARMSGSVEYQYTLKIEIGIEGSRLETFTFLEDPKIQIDN